jgi:RNase H-fold protein (predicted Holliday junction resolvase)
VAGSEDPQAEPGPPAGRVLGLDLGDARIGVAISDPERRVAVELQDERLSTVEADRSLREAGLDGRRRRTVVDEAAATVILNAWLDARG